MIAITLPDGSRREFPGPVTVAEVAQSIGAGLAKAALAGRVDGQMVDTSYTIDHDAKLAIITDKDADGVDVIRHSTAHLLAYAVMSCIRTRRSPSVRSSRTAFTTTSPTSAPSRPMTLLPLKRRWANSPRKTRRSRGKC